MCRGVRISVFVHLCVDLFEHVCICGVCALYVLRLCVCSDGLLFVYLSVCVPVFSVWLPQCMFMHLCVCRSVCLSVCVFVSLCVCDLCCL